MQVTFAGGVGEYGRSCFLVESEFVSFLVDCGILAGDSQPYPALTRQQAAGLRYVFLTHSHQDHSGALEWLAKQGFQGTVVATAATLSQIRQLPVRCQTLETFTPSGGLALRWGRSGHCAGSVWYITALAGRPGRQLFFSGDYIEQSLIYAVDPVRQMVADLAVQDSAYGAEPRTADQMRRDFLAAVRPCVEAGRPLLLPVPRYGRGQELLRMLADRWPAEPLYGDAHFCSQVQQLSRDLYWVQPQARAFLQAIRVRLWDGGSVPERGICFLSIPQLDTPAALETARRFTQAGGSVVLTGAAAEGSGAAQLRQQGGAVFARVPVHCTDREMRNLQRHNRFARMVAFHTPAWPCTRRVVQI